MSLSEQQWNVFNQYCPSRTTLARIASKWTAMLVTALADKPLRFTELRTIIDGISAKVLTDTLQALEHDGIVQRHVYGEVPPWVEYELTSLGHTLHEPIAALRIWAETNMPAVLAARQQYDSRIPKPLARI